MRTARAPLLLLGLIMLLSAGAASARDGKADSGPWIHIEVTNAGDAEAMVKVNLPLSLAQVALEAAAAGTGKPGGFSVDLGPEGFNVPELRKIWAEVRKAGDAEFVTVKEKDSEVRVFHRGGTVFIQAAESDGGKVDVQLPSAVMDALLGGADDELDLTAAVAALQTMGKGEIVRVVDGEELVRIWIE